MSFNLATILRETAAVTPDATVCHAGGTATTYQQLDEVSGRFAAGLAAAGMAPGQVKTAEIAYQLKDAEAGLMIGMAGLHADAAGACEQLGIPLYLAGDESAVPPGSSPFSALPSSAPLAEPGGDISPRDADDTAVLIYTSGTTGKPKGAELTHFLLYMNCTVSGQLFGARPDDVFLAVLPFFHVFGLSSVINVCVRYGAALCIVPRFMPGPVLDAIERDKCTVIAGVPTMLHALAQLEVAGRDLAALRVAVSGGASLPEDVMRTFENKYGIEVLEGYGLSETGSTTSFNLPGDRRPLSVGKPICIRGHNVMKGYRGQPEATKTTLRGGWLHTGDLGYRDEDGFYFIVDRTKDLVIRGGYNVYPREIEEVLYSHPGIVEAAVIGKPDERLGEEVVAVVVLKASADLSAEEIIAYCRERLAAYKYPREVRFRAELPKGPSGKILKTELREPTPRETAPSAG